MSTVTIPGRFNGPPASGNGGYVSGLLAHRLGAASVQVTLRAPPPLDTALALRLRPDGGASLHHGPTLLAEAIAAPFELAVPRSPGPDAAAAAGALGRLRARSRSDNPYRRCFGCGIERADGLALLPSPVDESGLVATDWHPPASLAGPDGTLAPPVVWTALDCPAGIAWNHRLPPSTAIMTGRITARIDRPLRAGGHYVAVGWPIAQDGRKLHAGSALFDADGALLACSVQLWLMLRGPEAATSD
jgi:hypothetical protein